MWKNWLEYGPFFRTHLLGYPLYVVGSAGLIKPVLGDDSAFEFFVPGKTFTMLISDIRHMQVPEQHAVFRRRLGQALNPGALSRHVMAPLRAVLERHLDAWEAAGRVQLAEACAAASLDVALEVLTGVPLPPAHEARAEVRKLFRTALAGLYGVPLPWLPGTAIHSALRAQARLMQLLGPELDREVAELAGKMMEAEANPAASAADAAGAAAGGSGSNEAPMRMLEAQVAAALPFHRSSSSASSSAAPAAAANGNGKSATAAAATAGVGLSLTKEQIFERALGVVIASDDTSKHLFFFALVAAAMLPGVRGKLEQEQKEAMRKHGDDLSYAVLNDMPYLDAVIKETIRVFPTAVGGFRRALKDVAVEGGHVIPAGSIVFYSTHLLNASDPALLPRFLAPEARRQQAVGPGAGAHATTTAAAGGGQPDTGSKAGRKALARTLEGPTGLPAHLDYECRLEEAFRPERWLSDETRPRQFTGFGGGSHLCLGMHVAHAEARMLLALVVRRFDLRLEDPQLLSRVTYFPGPVPRKGADGLVLMPRRLEP
ncbi:hypothetical protein HYH02_001417 [Chlamydomonas schloesseri]|uniref:Cytochrome P450 n=1 Tax=Chlamydomonas schloesseri TaxID=2026947 RepID=A0A835WUA5_9CHLO|nr:hypothetical protein HYH02_001417 [Chlamydomonas schloesseri]|eukprot:KAG2454394.1 hypothetical protein HYH02_001417 [Chlamydomonas schloesseri]